MQHRIVAGIAHGGAGDLECVALFQRPYKLEAILRQYHIYTIAGFRYEIKPQYFPDIVVSALFHIERVIKAIHNILKVDMLIFCSVGLCVFHNGKSKKDQLKLHERAVRVKKPFFGVFCVNILSQIKSYEISLS